MLSSDGTLRWLWTVTPGERRVTAWAWTGRRFDTVVADVVKTAA